MLLLIVSILAGLFFIGLCYKCLRGLLRIVAICVIIFLVSGVNIFAVVSGWLSNLL